MYEGAATEEALKLYAYAQKASRGEQLQIKGVKLTSATEYLQELADEYGVNLEDLGISTEPPAWFLEASIEQLEKTLQMEYWKGINDTTLGNIEVALKDGIERGLSSREVADAIMDISDDYSRSRAMNVSRTETGGALNSGHEMGIRQIGDETGMAATKQWLSVLGPTTRDTHAEADGQEVGVNEKFDVGGEEADFPGDPELSPEERCNCFLGSAIVQGDFSGAQRCWYEGAFTEIVTRAGRRLTVTPKHPIVTANGLMSAGMIKPGQKVMAYSSQIETFVSARASCNEINHEPVSIKQVFQTLASWSVSGAASIKIKRAKVHYFHGDGFGIQGDIHIVSANCGLLRDRISGGAYESGNPVFALEFAKLLYLPSFSASASNSGRINTSAPSNVGIAEKPTNSITPIGFITPSGTLAIGVAANFDASLSQSSQQDGPGITRFLGEALQRHAAFVSFDEVAEVRNFYSAGHVYDLQSKHGLIVASDTVPDAGHSCNGIVTSNCQCTIISGFSADELGDEEAPPEDDEEAEVDEGAD